MAYAKYTVVKGDTLSEIAQANLSTYGKALGFTKTYDYTNYLAKTNYISNKNLIYVGQVIILNKTLAQYDADTNTRNTSIAKQTKPVVEHFGLQSGSDRTIFATWKWNKSHTDHYQTIWYYATGDGIWFKGNDSTTTDKQSTYNMPSNATKVKFKVRAIAKKHKVKGKEVAYFKTTSYSSDRLFYAKNLPPDTPSTPTVEIKGFVLTAELDNYDTKAKAIEFQVVKDDKTTFKTGKANIVKNHAAFSCNVTAGSEYKVRCRAVRDKEYSSWTEYSNSVGTIPLAPKEITSCKAMSESSANISWSKVSNATKYEIQYTTKKTYFDISDEVSSKTTDTAVTNYTVTGLESGNEYFFRVRAVNDNGESAWTGIKSVICGKVPAAPTTWSSTTTAIAGESVTLYWVHNSEDGSSQTYAEIEIDINGTKQTETIKNSTNEDEKDKTSSYSLNPGTLDGAKIQWRVRTRGILPDYGPWSVLRTIDVYAPPTLELNIQDSNREALDTIESFPFYISAVAGPNNQTPIGYHITVSSNEDYETIDQLGNSQIVKKGDEVYSKYFDTSLEHFVVELSANNVDLENNVTYTVTCIVSMNSGLTAESSMEFIINWTDDYFPPDFEIGINEDTLTASIRPFVKDANDNLVEGVTLSVYRREFDGSFTELATGIDNLKNTYITDPHPALDYARYRIVAIENSTGSVTYYDPPGEPVGEKAVVIQWNEQWSDFVGSEDEYEEPSYSGNMLKLPYNIDVSDNRNPDVELTEYIGRKHPVSYYGTQTGETATWSVDIDKSDEETLYKLRQLSIYMGDVYVREPSGSGYWASVTVSFSQTHCEKIIPVTIDITRVEGGM